MSTVSAKWRSPKTNWKKIGNSGGETVQMSRNHFPIAILPFCCCHFLPFFAILPICLYYLSFCLFWYCRFAYLLSHFYRFAFELSLPFCRWTKVTMSSSMSGLWPPWHHLSDKIIINYFYMGRPRDTELVQRNQVPKGTLKVKYLNFLSR